MHIIKVKTKDFTNHKKKQVIVVGNKPIINDYSNLIDSYDYVMRINKMDNYIKTGKRIDGLFLGAYPDFHRKRGGIYSQYFKNAKDIYTLPILKHFLWNFDDYISVKQYNALKLISFEEPQAILGANTTSVVNMLWLMLNRLPEFKETEITLAGVDVYNRKTLMLTGQAWEKGSHKFAGEIEQQYLTNLIEKDIIKYLDLQ